MDPGGVRSLRSVRLAPEPASAGRARGVVDEVLGDWGLARLADDVALGVSELVANAVLHARTEIEVVLERKGAGVRAEVRDLADAATIAERVEEAARAFVDGAPDDDMAVVVVRVPLPGGRPS